MTASITNRILRAGVLLCLCSFASDLDDINAAGLRALHEPSGPSGANESGWALYADTCSDPDLLACGQLGKFRLGSATPPLGCVPVASGLAELHAYPRRLDGASAFPLPATSEVGLVETQTAVASGDGGTASVGSGGWLAVVDFDDDHGWSTTWLAGSVAGPAIEASLVPLDAPESDPLGPTVGDFHVLRALCTIEELVQEGIEPPPLSVNMSFGRLLQDGESWFPADCQAEQLACQIARVLGALSDRGSTLVAAAGNHDEMLFPAGLPHVTSTGLQDMHVLLSEGTPAAVREAPDAVDALAPGSHLCLRGGWPAPAGSSYSSAVMAGWLAAEPSHVDGDAGLLGLWWDAEQGCYVLQGADGEAGTCNQEVTTLIATLDGTLDDPCWTPSVEPSVETDCPDAGPAPPDVPGFDHWAEAVHPTPSGDPCVPCVGTVLDEGVQVLQLDLSDSPGLAPSVYVIEVHLVTEDGSDPVSLTDQELEAFGAGDLRALELVGYDLESPEPTEPSLWYILSDVPEPDCEGGSLCFWGSSNILIEDPSG